MTGKSEFRLQMEAVARSPSKGAFQQALIDVTDTADVIVAWFKDRGLPAAPADVIAMTDLVMVREALLTRRETWEPSS